MATTQKKRSEVPIEQTWKLEAMYPSDQDWEKDADRLQDLLPKLQAFQGRLGESAATLLEALRLRDEIELIIDNVFTYANMRSHQDLGVSLYQGMTDRAQSLFTQAFSAASFMNPEILALPEKTVTNFLEENEDLRLYRIILERLLREKPHVLSPTEEKLLAEISEMADAPAMIYSRFSNADLMFPPVEDSEGKQHEVTEGHYRVLMESGDRTLRKNALKSLFGTYGEFKNTFGATYSASVKKDSFFAKVKNFGSALEMGLFPDNVSTDVYDNLISAIRSSLPDMHRYVELRKKALQLDELHYYDMFVPMVDQMKMNIPFDKAQEMAVEALKPLGEEYTSTVQRAFDERWIDIYPNKGKRSGAYSWGTYSSNPFILLNYTDTLDDLFVLVHELGHSVHSYYSHKTQPYPYSGYTIFVAEVASTLNENLLLEKLLAETTDKNMRMYLLNHSLDQFRSTVFRQTMFAEFEKETHAMVEAGQSLTAEDLGSLYFRLKGDYYGPGMVLDEELSHEWMRVSHFYNAFYVYKYATGFAAALALSRQIREEGAPAVERYLNFLSGGSSQDPIDLLKGAGIDMSSPEPIKDALRVFKERLEELESLILS